MITYTITVMDYKFVTLMLLLSKIQYLPVYLQIIFSFSIPQQSQNNNVNVYKHIFCFFCYIEVSQARSDDD